MQGKECAARGRGTTVTDGPAWQGLTAKAALERSLAAGEGVSCVGLWGGKILRKRQEEVKDPETGTCHNKFFLKLW